MHQAKAFRTLEYCLINVLKSCFPTPGWSIILGKKSVLYWDFSPTYSSPTSYIALFLCDLPWAKAEINHLLSFALPVLQPKIIFTSRCFQSGTNVSGTTYVQMLNRMLFMCKLQHLSMPLIYLCLFPLPACSEWAFGGSVINLNRIRHVPVSRFFQSRIITLYWKLVQPYCRMIIIPPSICRLEL